MKHEGGPPRDRSSLRQRAEALLSINPRQTPTVPTRDMLALVHELEVHQVELEMQNQELQRAQAAVGAARDRFMELYEFAPVGYLTLAPDAAILEANLAAATLLGVERGKLTGGRRFTEFVDSQAQDPWFLFSRRVWATPEKQTCQLTLRPETGLAVTARLEGVLLPDGVGREGRCLLALIDVTAQHRAEQDLRDSEEQFRLLAEGGVDYALCMLDEQGRFIHWNRGAQRLLGYAPGQTAGVHADRLYPAEDQGDARMRQALARAAAGHAGTWDGWCVRADGSRFWGLSELTALFGSGGALRGFALVVHDITARKEAEVQLRHQQVLLRRSEERLAGLIASAMDPIISIDEEQRVVLFNAAAEEAFGCPSADALGQPIERFIPERFRPGHADHIRRFAQAGVTSRRMRSLGELSGLRANGSEFPVEAAISQVEVDGRKTFTVILRDITERNQARAQLQEINNQLEERVRQRTAALHQSERVLSLALWATRLAIWERDLRNDRLTVNNQWFTMLGYEPGQVEPTHDAWKALIHPQDWPRVQNALDDHLADRVPAYECEYRMRAHDGQWRWVESRGQVVERDDRGRPLRLTGTHRDITARKKAQHMLEVYQHNLRSLANQMVTVEERERRRLALDLHDGPSQLLVAAQMKLGALRHVLKNADHSPAFAEVGQLLTQAMHGLSTLTFELSPPVLHDLGLVPALKWLAEDMQRRHGLEVTIDDDDRLKTMDAHRSTVVFRCLRELLANVAKHAKMKQARVTVRREGEEFVAAVEDRGVGFSNGFDPNKALHTPGRGGFGLFSIYERLTQLGGRMDVRSAPEKGTVVTISVPLELPPADEREKS